MSFRFRISRRCLAVMLPLGSALWAASMSSVAGVSVPTVPSNVNCAFSATQGTVCGLYMDFSGAASASTTGAGQSFSYQPSWAYTNYRFADEAPADTSGGSVAWLHATDFVSFGALKSQLSATSTTSGWLSNAPNAQAYSNSNIGFQDRLTFNLTGAPAGTMGTMIGRMLVSGSVDASPANYPFTTTRASTSVNVNSITPVSDTMTAYGDRPASGSIPQVITFALPVQFNAQNFTLLSVQMQTSVMTAALNQQGATWAAAANANFFNSIEWGGIDAVLDSQGHPLTGWTVSSASGFDYTRSYAAQAVPEPETYALMLTGFGALAVVARHRCSQKPAPACCRRGLRSLGV